MYSTIETGYILVLNDVFSKGVNQDLKRRSPQLHVVLSAEANKRGITLADYLEYLGFRQDASYWTANTGKEALKVRLSRYVVGGKLENLSRIDESLYKLLIRQADYLNVTVGQLVARLGFTWDRGNAESVNRLISELKLLYPDGKVIDLYKRNDSLYARMYGLCSRRMCKPSDLLSPYGLQYIAGNGSSITRIREDLLKAYPDGVIFDLRRQHYALYKRLLIVKKNMYPDMNTKDFCIEILQLGYGKMVLGQYREYRPSKSV